MKQSYLIYSIFLLLLIVGCKSDKPNPISSTLTEENPPILLRSDSVQTLSINNFHVDVDRQGKLTNGIYYGSGASFGVIYVAGLWIAMEQDGASRGTIIEDGTLLESNYTAQIGDTTVGVFSINAIDISKIGNWPKDFGAPTDDSGKPRIYGDQMCWSALTSDTTILNAKNSASVSLLSQPLKNLRVTQTVYGYSRNDLQNVIFIRYQITNLSNVDWSGVYVGFYSDTDLGPAYNNQTGFDLNRSLSFTYVDSVNSTPYSRATGFSLLESGSSLGVTSSRMMRKDNNYNSDFGEYTLQNPFQILYVLQGLSNSGQPMIDPTNGLQSLYAFTGDPITRTGWLDVRTDVRSIISSGPNSIAAHQTKVISLAWVVTDGVDIKAAITSLDSKVDQIRSDPSLWQFN